jgi:hypothetical protein
LKEAVRVSILRCNSSQGDPPVTDLEYEVRNEGQTPVWLVEDGWLIWRQKGQEIELSYARGRMSPGAQVFGYFPPSVAKLDTGAHVTRTIHLTWPHSLDRLWNAESEAAPPPGHYHVSVRIGYGVTPAADAPDLRDGVEGPVLRWQREAVSDAVPMNVPG